MRTELSERQRAILRYIVQEYVRTGRAVGSKTLIERYELHVSSATVRNEMGELEERAYLQHPHTSAGRVPTDRGYRYYVEYLLEETQLPPADQLMIRHQFRQVESQLDRSARLAASILSELSGNLALVTPPRSPIERLRHFELISLREQVALLIVVTQSGAVHQMVLPLEEPTEQTDLSALSQQINPEVRNGTAAQVLQRASELGGLPALVLQNVAEAIMRADQESQSALFSDGLERTLGQPEFTRSAVAQRLLELLRGGTILSALLPQLELEDDVQVFIGSENKSEDLRSFGVVISTYGSGVEISGLLGVLGPTRMPYGRSISTVRYLAQVLSDLLGSIYEESADPPE